MEVEVVFMPGTAPKRFNNVDNIYTKGDMLCIREGEWIYKYPMIHVFSVCHKHGAHWGSNEHKKLIKENNDRGIL